VTSSSTFLVQINLTMCFYFDVLLRKDNNELTEMIGGIITELNYRLFFLD